MAEETKPTESNNRGSAQNAYDYESGRITVTITLAEYRELVGRPRSTTSSSAPTTRWHRMSGSDTVPSCAEMTSELDAWALSHQEQGGFQVIDSMRRSVPFVRQAFRARERAELRIQVDNRASRRAEVWTDGDVRRVMAGMRAGEPPEKTALVLRRTVSAVLTKMSQVRRIYPETMWRRV